MVWRGDEKGEDLEPGEQLALSAAVMVTPEMMERGWLTNQREGEEKKDMRYIKGARMDEILPF